MLRGLFIRPPFTRTVRHYEIASMATRVPQGKKAKQPEHRSNAEGPMELLLEIGPRHSLADAIESVYEERHQKRTSRPRGRPRRRRSTQT